MFYVKEQENGFDFSDTPKDDYVQVLEKNDMQVLEPLFKEASDLWYSLTKDYVAVNGDGGSCVIGAGIEVPYIDKKTPKLKGLKAVKVISQPRCCLGSINWEGERLQAVKDFLISKNIINTRYNSGWMD